MFFATKVFWIWLLISFSCLLQQQCLQQNKYFFHFARQNLCDWCFSSLLKIKRTFVSSKRCGPLPFNMKNKSHTVRLSKWGRYKMGCAGRSLPEQKKCDRSPTHLLQRAALANATVLPGPREEHQLYIFQSSMNPPAWQETCTQIEDWAL